MNAFDHTHTAKLTKGQLAHHILREHAEHIHPVGKELLRWTSEELVTLRKDMHERRTR